MAERRQKVTDEGSLHRYRTEIPNTIIRGIMGRNLTLPARWLYVYLKSIAGDSGECWQNMTTIAAGARLSRGAVSNARKELIEAQLIALTKGKGALHETDRIRILDIWQQNMAEFCGIASSSGEHEPSSSSEHANDGESEAVSLDEDSRVHQVNTSSSSGEHASSLHEQPSSSGEPKKISLKKIPEKNNPPVSTTVETSPQPLTPEWLMELYNTETPTDHPKVVKLTEARRKLARKRLGQFRDEHFWRKVMVEIGMSSLLLGHKSSIDHPNFKGDFDWLLASGKGANGTENCVKVFEGKYRDRTVSHQRMNGTWQSQYDPAGWSFMKEEAVTDDAR